MKAFDTYTHINDLKKVGFKEEQAAVIIRSLMDSREMDLANLATKEQVANIERNMVTKTYFAEVIGGLRSENAEVIAGVKEELKAEIAELRAELKAEIAGVKEELRAEIVEVRSEIAEVKVALKDLQINLIKWMVGLMIAFSGIIFAGIQLINI